MRPPTLVRLVRRPLPLLTCLGLALCLSILPVGRARAAPAACPGFRALCWGAPVEQVKGLMLVGRGQDNQPMELYTLPGDDVVLGGGKVDRIFYAFWQGRLASVRIEFHGAETLPKLRDFLAESYGSLVQPNRQSPRYLLTEGPSVGVLEYNEVRDKGSLLISSRESVRRIQDSNKRP